MTTKQRFLFDADVKTAAGSQTFYIDADTLEEAEERAANGESDGIYSHQVEVTEIGPLCYSHDVTSLNDYGDFTADGVPAENAQIEAVEEEMGELRDALADIFNTIRREGTNASLEAIQERAREAWEKYAECKISITY